MMHTWLEYLEEEKITEYNAADSRRFQELRGRPSNYTHAEKCRLMNLILNIEWR